MASVILFFLTLLGVLSTNIAQVELLCASADAQHTKAFYNAEAGANLVQAALPKIIKTKWEAAGHDWDAVSWPFTVTKANIGTLLGSTVTLPTDINFSVVVAPKIYNSKIVCWGDIGTFNTSGVYINNTLDGKLEENPSPHSAFTANAARKGYPIVTLTSTGTAVGASDIVEVIIRMDTLLSDIVTPLYGKNGLLGKGNSIRSLAGEGEGAPNNPVGCKSSTVVNCYGVDKTELYDAATTNGSDIPVNITVGDKVYTTKTTAADFCGDDTGDRVCGKTLADRKPKDGSYEYPIVNTINRLKDYPYVQSITSNPPNGTIFKGGGTDADPLPGVFYYNGNLTIDTNNITVYGILLVNGNLELGGNVTVYGTVLVSGDVTVKGGGNGAIMGALLAAGTVISIGNIETYYDCSQFEKIQNTAGYYYQLAWMTK